MTIPNLDRIRAIPDIGPFLYEALHSVQAQATSVEQQVNANPTGQPQAPPAINSLKVTGQNGHFQIAIQDSSPIYRDIHYWAEHASNQNFTDPVVIHMGQSRNYNEFLGNVGRYWRAYSSYSSSPPSAPVYHGGASPQIVMGGGSVGGPNFAASEGSGTGAAGQGLQGPGVSPFRTSTGAPPVR
jgi:hypothetical protein